MVTLYILWSSVEVCGRIHAAVSQVGSNCINSCVFDFVSGVVSE